MPDNPPKPPRTAATPPAATSRTLTAARAAAARFAARARSPATERAYRRDWKDFTAWCAAQGVDALEATPDLVAAFLAERAGTHRTSTLERRLAAICVMLRRAGKPLDVRHPAFEETWKGIRRTLGTAKRGKEPMGAEMLAGLLAGLPDTLAGTRDRALLAVGFTAALRRSELVALDVEDVSFTSEGAVLLVRRSKTDPAGGGARRALPRGPDPATCPVALLKAWMVRARFREGPLFRAVDRFSRMHPGRLNDRSVARIVQRVVYDGARGSGLSEKAARAEAARFGGHSLRAGFATSAAEAGAETWAIRSQTGHRSDAALAAYVRIGGLFRRARSTKIIG